MSELPRKQKHADPCPCERCAKAKAHVMESIEWDAKHAAHAHGPFTEQPFPHPDGNFYWKVCSCGAKHLRIRGQP